MSIFGASLIFSACSNEDEGAVDPQTESLEEVTLSFSAESESAIEVPASMSSSNNQYAQMAVGYVNMVNQIGVYTSFFTPPSNAEKSSQPISTSNARTSASQKEYLVYKWSYEGYSVAYQLSDDGDNYVWEIFWKEGDGEYKNYIYAEESKTKKKGSMKIYDIFQGSGDVLYLYAWEKFDSGAFTLTSAFPSDGFSYTVNVNADASGSVEYIVDDEKMYAMTWTSQGSGTWTSYSNGKVAQEGSWEV